MSRRELFVATTQPLAIAALSSTALLAEPAAQTDDPDDRPATEDDYASAQFDALKIDLKKAREAYEEMWTPIAVGLAFMGKSPDECREVVESMGDKVEMFDTILESLSGGVEWYRATADMLDGAMCRFFAGAARHVKSQRQGA